MKRDEEYIENLTRTSRYERDIIEPDKIPYFRTWDHEGEVFVEGTPVYEGKRPPYKKKRLEKTYTGDGDVTDFLYLRKEESDD